MRHLLVARAPPHRRDHRAARLGRDRGPPPRLPRSARLRGHRVRSRRSRSRRTSRSREGEQAAGTLLDLADPPTAIFAFNDNIAIGDDAGGARARPARSRSDLSVVGFDDVEHATIVTPQLTTVRQPLAEMGRTAVSLLVRLLENQSFETLQFQLATRLVVRDSTAPPQPRALRATA